MITPREVFFFVLTGILTFWCLVYTDRLLNWIGHGDGAKESPNVRELNKHKQTGREDRYDARLMIRLIGYVGLAILVINLLLVIAALLS